MLRNSHRALQSAWFMIQALNKGYLEYTQYRATTCLAHEIVSAFALPTTAGLPHFISI